MAPLQTPKADHGRDRGIPGRFGEGCAGARISAPGNRRARRRTGADARRRGKLPVSSAKSALAEAFCTAGVTVMRCDLPFRQARPHGPPMRGKAEQDQEGLRAAMAALHRETQGRIFLGGHSYGGRQASMLAAATPGLVEALLLLSYPLHPPQKPQEMRTKHFPSLEPPSLFVSGERDGFGTQVELEAALKMIPARTELMMMPTAGHELMSARNRATLPANIVEEFLKFAAR